MELLEPGTSETIEELTAALEELRVSQDELIAARVEAETQRSRYQDLFEMAPDGYVVTGPRGRIAEANRAAAQLFNIRGDFLLDKPLSIFIHREDRAILATRLNRLKSIDWDEGTLRLSPRGDNERTAHVTARAVRRWGGELEAVRWILRDVTEQRNAEDALRASREHIRNMASKITLAEEQERRRIAGEIHDHISQSLAVAKLRLGMLRESLSGEQLKAVDDVRKLLSQVLVQSRSLTFELSPAVLYELGLAAAIEWLIEQRANYGVKFEFRNDSTDFQIRRDVAVILFQSVRELLTNILKHARATQASIRISKSGSEVIIDIEDDGVGFNLPEQLSRRARNTSVGLFSVHERLDHLGGRAAIDTTPGKGTRIRLSAPLQPARRTRKKVKA
jgi:PAS domain S-box-containing protein